MRYEIVPCKPIHAGMLARRLRADDRAEIVGLGHCDVRRVLRSLMRSSLYCRSAFVDGEMAAMWGVTGSLMDESGRAWLLTGPAVERVPLAFYREGRRQIEEMLKSRRVLVSQVAFSYDRAIRFFRMLGFSIGTPEPIGRDGSYYCRIAKWA